MAIEKDYWDEACTDLMKRDKVLRRLITKFRDTGIISRGDPFLTLVRSIIGQQISVAAAQAVWNRVEVLLKRVTPKNILAMDDQRLRECGLSYRKIEYVKDLSGHFLKQGLAKANWQTLDDETVIRDLTAVRGIGLLKCS